MADQDRSLAPELPSTRPQSRGVGPEEMIENPQEDWGEETAEGATFSSNHTRRGFNEADHSQGAKTRRMTKDIISRRS